MQQLWELRVGENMSFDPYSVDFPTKKKKRYKGYKKGVTRKFKKFEEKL